MNTATTPRAVRTAKLNTAMYAAADKVGMGNALRAIQAEVTLVVVSGDVGRAKACLAWDYERADVDGFVMPRGAFDRAMAWVDAINARNAIR